MPESTADLEQLFADTIRGYFRQYDQIAEFGRNERIRVITSIFDYLVENRYVLQSPRFSRFQDTVRSTLVRFHSYDSWNKAPFYHQRLFNQQIPGLEME